MSCLVCDRLVSIADPLDTSVVVVYADLTWVAYRGAPPDSIMVAARRHTSWYWDLDESEQSSLGTVLTLLAETVRSISHSSPVYCVGLGENSRHFHVLLMQRDKQLADEIHDSIRLSTARLLQR